MRQKAILCWFIMTLGMLLGPTTAWAEAIDVRAAAHADYGRMVFNWSFPVQYSATTQGPRLVLTFSEPAETSFAAVRRNLGKYITRVTPSEGGRRITMDLTGDYAVRSFYTGASLVVDLIGKPQASSQAAPPPSPKPAPAPQKARPEPTPQPQAQSRPAQTTTPKPVADQVPGEGPRVNVRRGEHANKTRIVFDWTQKVPYRVNEFRGEIDVDFEPAAQYQLKNVRRGLNGQVTAIRQNGNAVVLGIREGAQIKHFYAGTKVVVDVFKPRAGQMVQRPERTGGAPTAAPAPVQVAQAAAVEQPKPTPAPAPKPVAEPNTPPAPKAAPAPKVQEVAPLATVAPEPMADPTPAAVGSGFSLRFDFNEPVAAAAFRRAGSVYLVFDQATQPDLKRLKEQGGATLQAISQVDIPRATVIKLETAPGFNPRARREGLAWIFDFGKLPMLAMQEVNVEAQPRSASGARLFVPVMEGGLPVPMMDPNVGDNLVVVPVIPLGHGINLARHYPQFDILPSAQGVVFHPKSDDLRVRVLKQGVELSSASVLKLSDHGKKEVAAANLGGLRGVSRIFHFDKWKIGDMADYRENKRMMEKNAAGLRGARRDVARRNLAQYYLSHGMGPEALGVLNLRAKQNPDLIENSEFRALRGVANYIMGRYKEAEEEFDMEDVINKDEGEYWLASARAAQGGLVENNADLKRLGGVIRNYPIRLKLPLALVMTESALAVGDVRQAEAYLEALENEEINDRQMYAVRYLQAKTKEVGGDVEAAIKAYEDVEEGTHRPSRAKAALAKAELLYKTEKINATDLIESLEKLRFAWRGDDFEFNLLRRLGEVYIETGNYREGLRTMRQAATYFRTHEEAEKVTQRMIEIFEELYLASKADELPPVTAIALYDEFRELTPAGEKGDEMIRKLADRLAAVDLLREASELLENQVQFRLSGLQKSQVGTRLAIVYLAANNPQRAIRALKKSETSELTPEMRTQRRHLEARALIDQSKAGEALLLLEEDETLDADLLRFEIYWAAADWRNVSGVLRRIAMVEGVRRNNPLDEKQAQLIMNLAVAYTLGNNERGVAQVRQDYGDAMEKTSLRDAFRLIANKENAGMLDPRTITQLIKPAENFSSFMGTYKEQLKSGELSAIN